MGDRCAEIVLFFSVSNTQGERGGKEERRGEEEEEEEEEGRGRGQTAATTVDSLHVLDVVHY